MPHPFERYVLMASIPLIGRLLKLRYLLFGSAVGGGYAVHNKYNEFKDSLPDISWINDVLPEDIADKISSSYASILKSISAINLNSMQSDKVVNSADLIEKRSSGLSEMAKLDISLADDRADKLLCEMNSVQEKYQREVERLENENNNLRKQVLLFKSKMKSDSNIIKKSLIDMYSDVLDELSEFDSNYRIHDQLPRVVVIGDQSSGKTSVLEMITQARIFPRGAGEMMTRSPVKVTLSQGPYHVAQLKNSSREYDLTSEQEQKELRDEIEKQMKMAVKSGETISGKVISLNVKGPGLQRMVLIDLPGIISTETQGMATNTKRAIYNLAKNHLLNPNAIILCIQDGSIDAERSNVTDLVSSIDPKGKRTIFVLTKVDAAEENHLKPDRLKSILEGRLFPMKALGYFAVVTGTGNPHDSIDAINKHERTFFHNSKLVKDGILKPGQITTRNLSLAVSSCFWNMVRQSIVHQLDTYTATRYNLEAEWKNMYHSLRQQNRDDLFDRTRYELLDQLVKLGEIHPDQWQSKLLDQMWSSLRTLFIDNILMKAYESGSKAGFETTVDINLARAIDDILPGQCVKIAREALLNSFVDIVKDGWKKKSHDSITNQAEKAVLDRVIEQFQWEPKAINSLHVIQISLLEDRNIPDRNTWDKALEVMSTVLKQEYISLQEKRKDTFGHSLTDQWLKWKSKPTPDQINNWRVYNELTRLLQSKLSLKLYEGDIMTVKNNLTTELPNEIEANITDKKIQSMWPLACRSFFLENCQQICYACNQFFSFYQKGFTDQGLDCKEVEFFWRVNRILETTANALRLQISSIEARRLERILRDVLDDLSNDEQFKKENIVGRRVDLAERLIKVRSIQHHLEEFMQALNEES
ncbi:hypothetical protein GJ496_009520 [Pomphorhynchus laevis]|nr:hypothetical protein GJ496_009520 [Pomphorhynchus laevis]